MTDKPSKTERVAAAGGFLGAVSSAILWGVLALIIIVVIALSGC